MSGCRRVALVIPHISSTHACTHARKRTTKTSAVLLSPPALVSLTVELSCSEEER